MSGYRDPVVHKEPTHLLCHNGPTDGELRSVVRSWWPVGFGRHNMSIPAGLYVRQGTRGGAHFEWYPLPEDSTRLVADLLTKDQLAPEGGGLFWVDDDLYPFLNKHFLTE